MSETIQILDEIQAAQRNDDKLLSENPLRIQTQGNLEFYTPEGQIVRERLKSEPRIKKELEQWFNHRCYFPLQSCSLSTPPSLDFWHAVGGKTLQISIL
jgi:hypothetical protein